MGVVLKRSANGNVNQVCEVFDLSKPDFQYRSLSSVARSMLPIAEEMHRQGMAWRQIAKELRVSHTTLFNWRRIEHRHISPGEEIR